MDLKTKTAQHIGDTFHSVIADLDAVAQRLAALQADTRRSTLLDERVSEFATRPVSRLGVAERLVGEAKLEAERAHRALAVGVEQMDIAVRCPEKRGCLEAEPQAKRA